MDWHEWHEGYDDPASGFSWRLGVVRAHVARFLDERPGPVRILSACAGDGRDVLGVLAERDDAARAEVVLVELDPDLAGRARRSASALSGVRIDVRTADAGSTDSYAGAAPADLVLLCGIFGNIDAADLRRTIAAAPGLCTPGATLLWTRGRDATDFGDLDAEVRGWFADAGFTETAHETLERGHRPTVGAVRYDGPDVALEPGARLFAFTCSR